MSDMVSIVARIVKLFEKFRGILYSKMHGFINETLASCIYSDLLVLSLSMVSYLSSRMKAKGYIYMRLRRKKMMLEASPT